MDSIKFNQLEVLILNVTKDNSLDKALIKLAVEGYHLSYKTCNRTFPQLAEHILFALKYIYNQEFDENIYNKDSLAEYFRRKFESIIEISFNDFFNEITYKVDGEIETFKKEIESRIYRVYEQSFIRDVFIERVTLNISSEYYKYYIKKFNITDINETYKEKAFIKFVNEQVIKYDTSNLEVDKKIELLKIKYDYRLKEVILSLQNENSKEEICSKLNITLNLYNKIREVYGLKRRYKKNLGVNNIKEDMFIDVDLNKEPIDIDLVHCDNFDDNNVTSKSKSEFTEGGRSLKLHYSIDRDRRVIALSKKLFKDEHENKLYCEVCGFNFREKYGDLGEGYIEGHHQNPLAECEGKTKTNLRDIRMVCSNCHRMIHKNKSECLTVEELKERIDKANFNR